MAAPHKFSVQGLKLSDWAYPVGALVVFAAVTALGFGGRFDPTPLGFAVAAVVLAVLFGTIFAAVHHAEALAHRTGEPFGTLILTVAVTVIEVALIASLMLSPDASPSLARDTVFAVIMIVCNGLVGLCILAGGLRYREQGFRVTGASLYITVLGALATLTLVLPNTTLATPGPAYSPGQLAYVSTATIALYAAFLYIQTVRHQEFFVGGEEPEHGVPGGRTTWNAVLLVVALVAVILLSKSFAAVVEAGVAAAGAPVGVSGILVAILILLPESLTAVRAARRNQLQRSINLALGSSLATIGLTVPAVAVVSTVLGKELVLGLDNKDTVLLALTLLISVLTFGTGRTNILYGFVHLVVFVTFLFLAIVP